MLGGAGKKELSRLKHERANQNLSKKQVGGCRQSKKNLPATKLSTSELEKPKRETSNRIRSYRATYFPTCEDTTAAFPLQNGGKQSICAGMQHDDTSTQTSLSPAFGCMISDLQWPWKNGHQLYLTFEGRLSPEMGMGQE